VRSLELFKGDLYSCSNDASLCRWDLSSGSGADLVKKDTLYGHQSFMYCLSGSDKFIASSSEDKTVRVWDGKNCFQVIRIPATSIWCCLFLKNGDICAGSNDGKIRVFTQAADRTAQLNILQKYEEALDAMTINEKELGQQINKEKLPFVEDLLAESGKKEGEVRMAKSSDGGVDAYQWSTGQWIKIGQVVSAVGSGQKKMHEGKEYDYVFDVDIQEGAPPLKLCYNTGMNPFAAAQEFIYQYELPQTYLDQIANFIITNANVPATIGEGSSGYSDPYTGASRYVPSGATQTTTVKQDYVSSIFPSGPQSYLAFKGINLDAVQKKISQLFEATPEILSTSDKIISRLKENKVDKQITAGLVSLITKSAQDLRFPFIDLLRFACSLGYEIVENDMTVLTQLLREESNQINLVLLLRLVCNVFEHENGRYLMDTFFEPINEAMLNNSLLNRIFAGQVEANGSIKNVQLAYVTFFMNSTVFLCHHEKAGSSSSNTSKDQINSRSLALLMMILNSTAAAGVDEECYYRVAVGIGNLLTLKNPELKDLLKQSQIIEKFPSSSDRIANLVNELTKLTS
jgi:phospholipase A-2-activating protein